ncbi:MAG: hypothetical protein E7D49_20120, partial [Klebsiella michiganensis]|nr:hypothetical protein [Klebsiella michiganensis]
RGDLIELIAQSVDHKTLCLSFFTRPLLGIPQRESGLFCYLVRFVQRRDNILKTLSCSLPGFLAALRRRIYKSPGAPVAR